MSYNDWMVGFLYTSHLFDIREIGIHYRDFIYFKFIQNSYESYILTYV